MAKIRKPARSGGRFFRADELKPGTTATITAIPYWETVTADDGTTEERFRQPILYKGEPGIWTPGTNAINILIEELGDNDTLWPDREIEFTILEVKTQNGTRYAKAAHALHPPLKTANTIGIAAEKCPNCGSDMPSGTKFCGQCGKKIGE